MVRIDVDEARGARPANRPPSPTSGARAGSCGGSHPLRGGAVDARQPHLVGGGEEPRAHTPVAGAAVEVRCAGARWRPYAGPTSTSPTTRTSSSPAATPPASSPTSGAWSAAARPPFDVSMPRRHRTRPTRSSASASTRSTAASRLPAPRPASRAAGARTAAASGWPSSSPPAGPPRTPFSVRAAGSTRQWSSATPPTWPPATARSAGTCAPRGGPGQPRASRD